MTTFARIVDGCALDVVATPPELTERFSTEWLERHPFTQVPDGTQHGARDDGQGGWINPPVVDVSQKPNTLGNPYFGKLPLAVKDFYALVGQVLPAKRYKRLTTDASFLWIKDLIDHLVLVDVDDKKGQFLQIISYLTVTLGEDSQTLMSTQERDAIMQAWK